MIEFLRQTGLGVFTRKENTDLILSSGYTSFPLLPGIWTLLLAVFFTIFVTRQSQIVKQHWVLILYAAMIPDRQETRLNCQWFIAI